MSKQIDFVAQRHAAQRRVENNRNIVEETQYLYDNAVKNKMTKAAERLAAQLKRQKIALAHAEAELKEWEGAK